MSSWTTHVKEFAKKNSISYKDALKGAGATYTKATKAKETKEPKVQEAGEAKMPVKRKKKEEKKEEMPAIVAKAEKRDKLVVKHEEKKRVESAEAKGKGKKGAVLM